MSRRLRPLAVRIDRVAPVEDVVGDAVLRERRGGVGAPEARGVGLVLAEQQLGARLGMEVHRPELVVVGSHSGPSSLDPGDARLRLAGRPRPGVAEPQRRQHVEGGGARRAVVHRDATDHVLRAGLGVLHLDVEVVAVVEDARVDELVLHLLPGSGPVGGDEIGVGELGVRVLVQPALVAVGRQVVDVEVVLLHVLAVVALGVGQTEQALLQNRVALVPQRQRQAEALLVVTDAGEAVLAPAVGPGPGLVVGEVRPRIAVVAVVLAHRPPLALAEVGPPHAPRLARSGLDQSLLLGGQRARRGHGRWTLGHHAESRTLTVLLW